MSWSHYRLLMRIKELEKRAYYQQECVECVWSVRQLERQINSFYYERILATSEAKRTEVRGVVIDMDTLPPAQKWEEVIENFPENLKKLMDIKFEKVAVVKK